MNSFMDILPWIAVTLLSLGYWTQVWKIHRHKEVRDLSIVSYILLLFGFLVMAYRAYLDQSLIFMVKQIATSVPTFFIVVQIWYHQGDRWHDDHDDSCYRCGAELEPHWSFCADCGTETECSIQTF